MEPALAEEIKAAGFPEPVLKPLTSRELDEMIRKVSLTRSASADHKS